MGGWHGQSSVETYQTGAGATKIHLDASYRQCENCHESAYCPLAPVSFRCPSFVHGLTSSLYGGAFPVGAYAGVAR
jgi:hypothetical protein